MSLNILGQLRTEVVGSDSKLTRPWSNWFATALVPAVNNTTPLTIPGPYANDAAAQAGGVGLQSLYYDASGTPHVRIV